MKNSYNFLELSLGKDGKIKPKKIFNSVRDAVNSSIGNKTFKSLTEALNGVKKDLEKFK